MLSSAIMIELPYKRRVSISLCGLALAVAAAGPAIAAGCAFEAQGEGRVAAVIDARTFRLQDGREVRLAGIEPVCSEKPAAERGPHVGTGGDRDRPRGHVGWRGRHPRPIRPPARLRVSGSLRHSVQGLLLAQGEALVSATVTDKDCASVLTAAEAAPRQAKRGIWADSAAIKNAESPGDILAGIGRFMVVEGKVLSVRQAGATTYLNFGRNWTRGFAVTISRRMMPAFEAAGIVPKSLENRRIRVRGWVEARGGPRIEALRVGQIELLGEN